MTVSVDVDVARYATGAGDRRVIAAGAEQWLFGNGLGFAAVADSTQVGHEERSATAGVSAASVQACSSKRTSWPAASDDERGWGVAARVSF